MALTFTASEEKILKRDRERLEKKMEEAAEIYTCICVHIAIYIYTCTCIITTTLILEDYPPRKDFEMCVAQEKATSLIE